MAIRIRGGRIICRSCRRSGGEVVLLEPGRPLCVVCLDEQLGGGTQRSCRRLSEDGARPEA